MSNVHTEEIWSQVFEDESRPLTEQCASRRLDFYQNAVEHRERQKMPDVGESKDRVLFRHLQEHASSEHVYSLVCFICAQIYTDTSGSVTPPSSSDKYSGGLQSSCWYDGKVLNTDISYQQGQLLIDAAELISESLSVDKYKSRYGKKEGVTMHIPELDDDKWQWRRKLQLDATRQELLMCCPEDVQLCAAAKKLQAHDELQKNCLSIIQSSNFID